MTLVTFRGALLIFRFCYGQFEETTLYRPSGRHRFLASVIPSVPLFVGPSMASVFGPVKSAHFASVKPSGILWHRFFRAFQIVASVVPSESKRFTGNMI